MGRMIIMDRNENNYGPSPKCHEVLERMDMEYFSTYSRDYPRRIKSRIAEQYGVDSEQVAIGYGAEDLLKQIIYWAASKGLSVAVPNMSWWYYKHIVKEIGGNLIEYHLSEQEDGWDFDDDEILRILAAKPRVFIISSPNNPTGNYLEPKRIKRYLEAKDPGTIFVLDEAYWGFGAPHFPEREIGRWPGLIVLRTLSKYYALAGLRVGFAFLGTGLDEYIVHNSKYLGFNRISEEMLFAALDHESDAYYKERAEMITEDGKMLFRELRAMGFKSFHSCANFILARLPPADFQLLKERVVTKGIVIKFFSEPNFQDCIRISIGTREQNCLLVEIMKEILADGK
jgi:histidinol-phosphate aminotransferase